MKHTETATKLLILALHPETPDSEAENAFGALRRLIHNHSDLAEHFRCFSQGTPSKAPPMAASTASTSVPAQHGPFGQPPSVAPAKPPDPKADILDQMVQTQLMASLRAVQAFLEALQGR